MDSKTAILSVGLVLAAIFATKQDVEKCEVNNVLAAAIADAQKEASAAAEHSRKLIAMLPKEEQEKIAIVAENVELKKKLKEVSLSCPQK